MELLEFQVWKNKFYELRETLANIEGMTNDNTLMKMKFVKFGILCQIMLSQ